MSADLFFEEFKYKIFLLGFGSVIISSFFAFMLFKAQADIVIIFLSTLAITPFIYYTIKIEENYDFKVHKEKIVLKHHFGVIKNYLMIFFGAILGFLCLYLFLPDSVVYILFKTQIKTLVLSSYSGNFLSEAISIFLNNSKILIFCIFLSLFYGSGAILILMWNASIIGLVIGNLFVKNLGHNTLVSILGQTFLGYFIHGTIEIAAYFVGTLAGGIISIAAIRHHYKSKKFKYVLKDSTHLVVIAFLLLLIASLVEVLITNYILI